MCSDTAEVYLRKPLFTDLNDIKLAYKNSEVFHQPWTFPPPNFQDYLQQQGRYFLILKSTKQIIGTFNISNIVRGHFHSAYLGYEVFHPYQGQGYMRLGLSLLLEEAFQVLNLHRLEANIQPENTASIRLVAGAGFIKEGFSKQYLRIGGTEWKDHERWAIVNEDWVE